MTTPLTTAMLALLATVGLTTVLVACSDTVEAIDSCAKDPARKGCKNADAGSSPATTYATTVTDASPVPIGIDAAKPDAAVDGAVPAKPVIPPANAACRDLTACCGKVKDSLERAGCVAIAVTQNANVCANAMIAYQVFGGCGHSPLKLPDIFNSDKTPNSSKDCSYLEAACISDPTQCDAAYQCNGVSAGGTDTTPPIDDCVAETQDPTCCRYPNSYDCGGSPDPCATADNPTCCRYPNSDGCFVGPPAPVDPPVNPVDPPVDPVDPPTDPAPYDPCEFGCFDP